MPTSDGAGRVSRTDDAIRTLKAMITDGELPAGSRLPREVDLAARLGLSRNSLREAIRALTMLRILDVRQGDGTYVTSLEPTLLLDTMGFVVDFQQEDSVLHFFEVRRILEPAATAMAAHRITAEGLAILEETLSLGGPDASVETLVQQDILFHQTIAEASGNPVLRALIAGLSAPTLRARMWRGTEQEDARARTIAEHRQIYDALVAGQADVACACATVHIAGVEGWIRRAMADDAS
ncbi:FadR/GntR family transcriptional regulator [Tsukamurella ocularis]|uniref:FadR/GntR family transcriptional regulator n=1 Tax=Tsukamurella ocularis TaxID=1970234 RepID=UPI002168AE50|nr:FadR/GntR family transcriptional regulator [Tsukamurella ocularis]MCS3781111.1 GntR family transcriptional repressor for pyruvate dehydrogenase complex [Tsukamurella ocularis]MCS3786935.1 GntR family transcriptional repressor for pyruvate dehydrogenase complex [Tsukamurella ocularis]MCS3850777.1 GntR family transcriptional repressor for pyruvate dehydrogenase complex [Tsukamurella ocularis]